MKFCIAKNYIVLHYDCYQLKLLSFSFVINETRLLDNGTPNARPNYVKYFSNCPRSTYFGELFCELLV